MNEERVTWARRGHAIFKWINDCTPGPGVSEISEPSVIYNVTSGKQIFITRLSVALQTASDDCHFNMAAYTGANATGTATDLAGHLHIYSSANLAGTENRTIVYDPPIRVRYSDGYRSISVRTTANDAACTVSIEWQGWYENEI